MENSDDYSKNNLTGFVLALMSSGFIGSSFIIKKKGLRKAAAISGLRAGYGGYGYLLEPLWWIGLITIFILLRTLLCYELYELSRGSDKWVDHIAFVAGILFVIVGEIANFTAYAFAPAVLVTPLGALSVIVSAVLAHFMLNERLHKLGVLGCVMCITGSVIIVIHAPQEHPISSVMEVWNLAIQPAFLLYVGSVIVLVFILVFHFAPQCGHTNVLVFTGICSLMGSLSVMSVKALGTALKLTLEGNNQLIFPETWFFMLVVASCIITQMNYLNKALDTFNTAVVSPIYYVMFTTLTILASVIMFKDWDGQSGGSIVSEICGFITVLSGSVVLHATKESDPSSSFRGYLSVSPALSTQFCDGEFPKLEEENAKMRQSEANLRNCE